MTLDDVERLNANNVLALFDQIIIGQTALGLKIDSLLTQMEIFKMSQTALDASLATLATQVAANTSVSQSASAMIAGIGAQVTAAVNAALAAGATPAQLAAITALGATLTTDDANLAAAITANTPVPPPVSAASARKV